MREGGHHHASRRRRCLEEAGFVAEVAPTGKRYWRTPETGDLISEERAFALAKDDEERALEAAGWEPENIEEYTYWIRPASGSFYPRGAAYDVLRGIAREWRSRCARMAYEVIKSPTCRTSKTTYRSPGSDRASA